MKNVFKRKRENNNNNKNVCQLKEVHYKVRLRFLETVGSHMHVVQQTFYLKGEVSKETVVLRRWGSSIQKFGFMHQSIETPTPGTYRRFNAAIAGI